MLCLVYNIQIRHVQSGTMNLISAQITLYFICLKDPLHRSLDFI